MERHIANEFNKNILCPEEPLPRAVVDQLLMLTFSFAARLLVFLEIEDLQIYMKSIGYWQMETLLSAYKILSTKNDANGVYSLQITQIPEDISEYTAEHHNQYIENFTFLLELSEFSLTSFEVYKLLETILIDAENDKSNVQAAEQQPSALYTFLKQYFVEIIGKKSPTTFLEQFRPNSEKTELQCALLLFGIELHWLRRLKFNYSDFKNYYFVNWRKCEDAFYNNIDNNYGFFRKSVFNGLQTNYMIAIQIDVDQCKGVRQFAEALRKIVVDIRADAFSGFYRIEPAEPSGRSLLDNGIRENDYSNTNGPFKSNEFKILLQILNYELRDSENVEKLKYLKKHFGRKKTFSEKTLNELLALLDQIIGEYSCTSACKFKWNRKKFGENIPKFGQIFFETFEKYSGEVKYDGKGQLMSFPQKLAEHFLQRLYALIKIKSASICQIGEELDFIQTMQNVASTEQLKFVRRKKIIPIKVNIQFFKMLFSLAFRLSLQIDRSDLAGKYLNAFEFAYNCIKVQMNGNHSCFFKFKINISKEIVAINLPNWKLPNYMREENINELRQQKVKKNFDFLLSLSNCTPTFYEILKVAKKLGEIELPKDDAKKYEIWLNLSDSKLFFRILKYIKQLQEPIKEININVEKEFCFLAHFVEYLFEEMATGNKIPKIESIEVAIGHFVLVKEELCKDYAIENDVKKYFGENLVNFGKVLNTDFSPHNELQQIVSEIVEEIEQIQQNDNWNYANLNITKIVEWNLLEFNLHKMGNNDQKWEEIDQLRGEAQKAYSNWYSEKNEEKKLHFEKVIGKLIEVLRGI
ncbi:hypothetical protein GPALN_005852 [Globodera pallida]|nr:hypothetical protein GPALN_005852 [Globodera pallida]